MNFFLRFSYLDLLYTFLWWSPVGVFSCLVFLEYDPVYAQCIEERHWRYQVLDFPRCHSQKVFAWLEMSYDRPLPRTINIAITQKFGPDGKRVRRR